MERADVVVVGASAAGLAAALAVARAGASVVLLEGRDEVGVPEPPALLGFDFLWTFAERPTAEETRVRLDGVRLQSPVDAAHALEVEAPLAILRRSAFDARLARLAREAGADVRTGVRGLRVLPDRTLRTADDRSIRGRVTIYADGAGTLARAFLRPVRDPDELAWGAALSFRHPDEGERFVTLTPGSHAPGGRSQLNPQGGGEWSHWTFFRGPAEEAEVRARAALRLDARARGWPAAIVDEARLAAVAPDPVYTVPGELVADGVMVAGGAAGQGGLEVGLASGDLAGRVAAQAVFSGDASAEALREYERQWKREWLPGYRALRRTSDRVARLDDAAIDKLLEPWSGWRVPVRDVVGLWHRSPARRAEALAKFVARNPHAVPLSVLAGWRALLPRLR